MALMKREKCSVELSDKEAKVRFSLGCLEAFAIAELKGGIGMNSKRFMRI